MWRKGKFSKYESVFMIVTVGFTLVINDPCLTNRVIWLVGVDVLKFDEFISEHIHGVSGEFILESFGANVVVESLIMETFPVVDNHVFVESFEESTSWKTDRFQTSFFRVINPLLFKIWVFLSSPFREIDVMDTSSSWSILICWISSDSHSVSITIGFCRDHIEWESLTKSFQISFLFKIMWFKIAFLNGKFVFCCGGVL